MTNAEARFNNSLCPRKPDGSLGRTAQDGHLDSHTAPELSYTIKIKLWQDIHTLQASPSGTLPPNLAIIGYATEGALLIFTRLPTEITPTSVMPSVSSVNL